MMAAITAAGRGRSVTLYEKNDKLGKKLALTGGGRCNLTYAGDPEELLQNVISNPNFLYSSFYTFGSDSTMEFFARRGVPLKAEENRVFPKSDKSSDIIDALERALAELKVKVLQNHPVRDIRKILRESDKVIIAAGGCSYPATGSTGDGYKWAGELGHNIVDLKPALVPLLANVPDLAGLSLTVGLEVGSAFKGTGELLFTHKGISGPIVLKASRYISDSSRKLTIDFMPSVSSAELDRLLLNVITNHQNKSIGNTLEKILPKRLVSVLLDKLPSEKIREKKANAFTKEERTALICSIKSFPLEITGTAGFKEAVITAGGVDVREVNPSTMESKKVPGLFFAGEVLDVDALTGGFNLQIAFSTGYMAGNSV